MGGVGDWTNGDLVPLTPKWVGQSHLRSSSRVTWGGLVPCTPLEHSGMLSLLGEPAVLEMG